MCKKVLITCMAVAAFAALAMSASASAASPVLTNASGGVVPVGEGLKATNIGVAKFKGGETIFECSNDVMTGKLTANPNNGKPIEATIETASFKGTEAEENCKSSLGRVQVTDTGFANGTPYCITFIGGDIFQTHGGACGAAHRAITYIDDIHTIIGVIQCHFERTAATGPLTGTFTTNPADAKFQIPFGSGSRFVGTSGGLCPTVEELEWTFELRTAAGGTLTID
jgi:hypothetical protein